MVVNQKIKNLYSFLKNTKVDEIIVRTTYVDGGWHDNEFAANAAGFRISTFINPEYEAKREFAECYRITRK